MEHKVHRNRRTLKRRIKRITFLCILLTIVFFSIIVIYIGAAFFKDTTVMISSYFSSYVAKSMSTEQFAADMGLNGISELKPGNEKFKEWLDGIKSESSNLKMNGGGSNILVIGPDSHLKKSAQNIIVPAPGVIPPPGGSPLDSLLGKGGLLNLQITVNDSLVYSDGNTHDNSAISYMNRVAEDPFASNFVKYMLVNFNSDQVTEVRDKNGNTVIRVSAKLNDGYILLTGLLFSSGILLAAVLAMVAGLIIARIFTVPVSTPLCKLDEKIKAIASDSNDATMTSQIQLKRPLREIESLAESTNTIMLRMREVNELLTAQNEELEAQNEELFNSRKQVEETQTMLVQSENMASVGQLTAAITHEINTPLGAIHSNAQIFDMLLNTLILSDTVNEDKELKDVAMQLKEANDISLLACNRVSQIIRSLKNFSKIDQAEFQEADINEGIRSVLVLTSNLWKHKISIHEEYGELPLVKCYSGMLNQVFMNLIVNAVQAIQESGDIFIKTWKDEEAVYVSIRDTGCGIREGDLWKIFENGYTTKGSNLGMGLGLSISRSIVNKHNGNITVSSKPGEGTEFTVTIPLKNS